MKFQKGQSVVEFAIVLPLFLLLIFSIFYFGMIFADYLTLSNVARSSARDAAMIKVEDYQKNGYQTVLAKYTAVTLPIDFYTWAPKASSNTGDKYLTIKYDTTNNNVNVSIKAELNSDGNWLANVVKKLLGNSNSENINLNITYTMYSENTHTN